MLKCPICKGELLLEDNFTVDEDSDNTMCILGTCYGCKKMISFVQKGKEEKMVSIEYFGCDL